MPNAQVIKTLGRAPLEAGPAWDKNGVISPIWMRWFNGITTVIQSGQVGNQILVSNQAGIAGLPLTIDNPNTFVFVTDYYHWLKWDGTVLDFADDGSNHYTFSDHAPSKGWVPVQGQTVKYLQSDGTLGTKNLNDTTVPAFLKLGVGLAGGFTAAVAPTVTGTCSVSVSGSVSVTVSSTGNTGTGLTGTDTTGSGVTGIGTTGTGTTGTGTSGATAPSFSGSATLSGNTGASTVDLSGATFIVGEGSISGSSLATDDVTLTYDYGDITSITTLTLGPISYLIGGGGEGDCSTCPSDTLEFDYVASISHNTASPISPNPHNHNVTGTATVSGTTVTGPSSAGSHTHSLSGSAPISGSVSSHTHSIPGLSIPGLSVPSLTVFGLSIPALTIPSLTVSTTGSGTGSFSGSGSGSITATAQTNGTPRSWNMTPWFRI